MSSFDAEKQDDMAEAYALGVLNDEERRGVESIMHLDSAFKDKVYSHLERVQLLADAVPAVEPPPAVWKAVHKELDFGAEGKAGRNSESMWSSLNFWRGFGLSTGVLAMALAVTLTVTTPSDTNGMIYLVQDNQQNEWMLRTSTTQSAITIQALDVPEMGEGEFCQLWAKTTDGTIHSLGKLPTKGSVHLEVPAKSVLSRDTELMITIENQAIKGSSPSNRVISQGKWVVI
ncbi:MAG: anti-sigma factor [Sedimenticola sp.]